MDALEVYNALSTFNQWLVSGDPRDIPVFDSYSDDVYQEVLMCPVLDGKRSIKLIDLMRERNVLRTSVPFRLLTDAKSATVKNYLNSVLESLKIV